MGADTSDHGFERRKDTPASAKSADSVVDDATDDPTPDDTTTADETHEHALETDAADADLLDADLITADLEPPAPPVENSASAHRKRPAAPRRAEPSPTTGAIPTERIEVPSAQEVYDYDTDHRGMAPVPAIQEEAPQFRATSRQRSFDDEVVRGHNADPEPRRERRSRRRRGRAGWIAATFIFFLLFGSAATLDWYLWDRAQEWEEHSHKLTEVNYDLGSRLASEQQTTMQLNSEIDLLTQQLATSNQTVTALSAEKAGAVDQTALHQQEIESLRDTLVSAGSVANSLHRCVDEQQQLAEVLRDSENYEPEDLENFSDSVSTLCDAAEQANERLQEALNQ